MALAFGVPGIALFFTQLIGKLEADTVASHQIVLNFTGLTHMIPMTPSFGVTIPVGHVLGEGSVQAARLRSFRVLFLRSASRSYQPPACYCLLM